MIAALISWALLAAAFSIVASVRILRQHRAPPARAARWPAILLLRPVDAPSAHELANLAQPIDYAGAIEQVLLSSYPVRLPPGVRWLFSDPLCVNRKVGHWLYALAAIERRDRIVVSVDADVAVDGTLLRALVAPLLEGAALVTAAPRAEGGQGIAARAERGLLNASHHCFVALYAMAAGARAVCGKAIALAPSALEELPALAECIGEDLELAVRLHRRGLRVALAATRARVPQELRVPAAQVADRFTRWMHVLKAHRPSLFPTVPLLFCCTPMLLGLAAVSGSGSLAVAALVLIAARTLLGWSLTRTWSDGLDWFFGECLLLLAFARSIFGSRVKWRGRTFDVAPGGRMRLVGTAR